VGYLLIVKYSSSVIRQVSTDIFTRVGTRVADCRGKVQRLNDRIALAQLRVDHVKNTNKATRVFSGAKYPLADEEVYYRSMFASDGSTGVGDVLKAAKTGRYVIRSKHTIVDDKVCSFSALNFVIKKHNYAALNNYN